MKIDYFKIPEITISYNDTVKTSERLKVNNPEDVLSFLRDLYKGIMQHHEEFYAIYLNPINRVFGIVNISKGSLGSCDVDVRIILQTAIVSNASKIILVHNHPSGNVIPSKFDMKVTSEIKKGCEIFGIELSDHIIMTDDSYISFAECGYME